MAYVSSLRCSDDLYQIHYPCKTLYPIQTESNNIYIKRNNHKISVRNYRNKINLLSR